MIKALHEGGKAVGLECPFLLLSHVMLVFPFPWIYFLILK